MLKSAEALSRPFRPFIDRFVRAEIPTRAAALAYHTLLSIVPMLGLAFWYLSSVGVAQSWQQAVEEFIYSHLDVTESSGHFIDQFERLTGKIDGKSIGLVGLAVFFYTAYNLVTKFGNAIDDILNTHPEKPSFHASFIKVLLRRGLLMLSMPIALMITIVIAGWLRKDSWLHYVFDMPSVGNYLAMPIPWLVDIGTLCMIYHFIPRRRVPWSEALRAALIAGPVFIAAKALVGVYNRHALSAQKIYGALAAIPLLIAWVQLAWLIILSGALFIRVRSKRAARKAPLADSGGVPQDFANPAH